MNPEEVANYLKIQLSKAGASDVVVSTAIKNAHQIKYSNNKINATKSWELTSVGVFACYNGRIVVTDTRDVTKSSADETIKNIISLAKATKPNREFQGIAKGPFTYKEIPESYDKNIVDLSEKGVDYVEEALNLAIAEGAKRSSGVLEYGEESIYLITSNDVEAREKATKAYFSIRAFNDKHASGHMVSVAKVLDKLDIKSAVLKASSIAKEAVNPKTITPGKYDVIFDHLPFANILGHVGGSASIFAVESGLSCLEGKLNKRVASEIITLTDDATLKSGLNSTSFDAEGVPTKKKIIIQDGILKTYLHNTSTAKRHNTTTTANAGLISPEPFNIILNSGNINKDEIFEQTKRGIYLTNVWYTRFQNYHTGDFSTIPRDGAFLIENGKIVHPVKDIRLSDNIINILKSTEALSKKTVQIQGWEVETPVTTPMALVRNLSITQSEK